MPRRRNVRTTSKRPKVKVPEGTEGENLSEETRAHKLEVLLKDFDDEVELRMSSVKDEVARLIKDVESMYKLEIMKIPKDIQNMKMSDFLKAGGNVNEGRLMQSRQQGVHELETLINLTVKKGRTRQMDPIQEESQNMVPPKTVRQMQTVKGTSRTTRSTRNGPMPMTTPMHQSRQLSGWETPMATPAFDPRLPNTPAVRRQKRPGEKAILLSENGSPLVEAIHGKSEQEFLLPIGKQRTLCIPTAENLQPGELPDLDNEAVLNLRRIHHHISTILEYQNLKK